MEPHQYSSTEEGPPPKVKRVKSPASSSVPVMHPMDISSGGETSWTELQRASSPMASRVSMKSSLSIIPPIDFSSGPVPSGSKTELQRASSPMASCVSMKSSLSIIPPIDFSSGPVPSGSKHDLAKAELHTGDPQQDSYEPADDALHRVIKQHKKMMKNKYEMLYEGIKAQISKTQLNSIYTQLCIIEGEDEEVNEDVLQMEKRSQKHLQGTTIKDLNIFKSAQSPKREIQEECTIRASVVEGLRPEEGKEWKEKDTKGCNLPFRSVMTKGIAGIGKTVYVQKCILDWAEGKTNQDVDFMFVLPFRELNLIKDDNYSLHRLLCVFHPDLKDLDPKIYDRCKIVFIFDGLDESRIPLNFSQCEKVTDIAMTSSVDVLMTNLIKGELFPSALIWITSRPAAASKIPSQYINRVTEIQGFNDSQKEEYFRKRISDRDQADRIISHIKKTRSLHIMCNIPVFCWVSATVLQHIMKQGHTEIPKNLTAMYTQFLHTQESLTTEKYEENGEKNPKELNKKMFLKLAELAFKQLMKGNVMFYEEDLRECGIDGTEAAVYSGICTEIFREESVLHQRKVYCFVHLSFQEFLAALYVFHCYVSKNMEELQCLKTQKTEWSDSDSLDELQQEAICKALESVNGHLDLFLRFLLGISLESNQELLKDLLTQTVSSSESTNKTVQYIKHIIHTKDLPIERSINLFLCLNEMNDQSLSRNIQEYLKSEKCLKKKLSTGECLALAYMLLISDKVEDELDLKNYSTYEKGYRRLIPAVSNCRKAVLTGCRLTLKSCQTLCFALKSANSSLKELDLNNNDLQDSGVELLCDGLRNSNCKLEKLRLASCNFGKKACENLGSVLQQEHTSLKELDLSNNDLQDSGVDLLSAGLKDSHCKLEILRLALCNLKEKSCENIQSLLQLANASMQELDLSYNDLQDSGVELLCDGLRSSHCKLEKLRLVSCSLGEKSCEHLGAALKQVISSMKVLNLSCNDLQDSGVEMLSDWLKSSHCNLEILRLSGCLITEKGCSCLALVLCSNPSHLKELDLTYNYPGQAGVNLLSARLEDTHCRLDTLRMEYAGIIRMKPGPRKYSCELTLDPNTAHTDLSLRAKNKKVVCLREKQSYPDHPERFDRYEQVLCRQSLTGHCYWEVEWSGSGAVIAVTYKAISRKGCRDECGFGRNEKSWSLICSNSRYSILHNMVSTYLPTPPFHSNRVGVYLDWSTGTLSFYSVSADTDTLSHLHTFHFTCTEPLYAGFRLWEDSSVYVR